MPMYLFESVENNHFLDFNLQFTKILSN